MKYLHLLDAYQQAVLLGLFVYFVKKYVAAPGWNVGKFLRTEPRNILSSILATAVMVYLTPDAVKIISASGVVSASPSIAAVLAATPKMLGFFTGVTGGSIGYDLFAMLVSVVPGLKPLVDKYVLPGKGQA